MWRLREGAHPALTDAGGAILDERTGRWTHLTPTATAAVLLLLSCDTQQQAAQRYADRYGLTTEHAAADVRTVADALTAQGLTVARPAPQRRWWRWWR
ncbi:PqqD family peptide modification chaperone [Streptomyces sp. NPDC001700]